MTSLPVSWFRGPWDLLLKNAVKPATMLTRRKEIEVSMRMPREVFEEWLSPLTADDAAGLKRDEASGALIPTKSTAAVRTFKYLIRRGSVSDRLFHLQTFDPSPPPPPPPSTPMDVVQIGEEDAYEVEQILNSRLKAGCKRTREYLIKWEGWAASYNSWEPARSIDQGLIRAYEGKPPAPPPASRRRRARLPTRGAGCARANLSEAAEKRGEVPQSISMICGNVEVELQESVKQLYMPKAKVTFTVLTMDRTGHIVWPTTFEPATRAALRMQARVLLKRLMDDPLSPVDTTMAPALTSKGTDSIFKPGPKRKFMEVDEA